MADHRKRMVNLAMQWTRDHGAAEDVVQDTLAELLEKYAAFELRERGVKTWLTTSLIYRIHDE